jgi:signal transduction histidine kinase
MGNANKFTSGGVIKVSAITKYRQVIIKVNDSGIYMTLDVMESLSHRTWSTNTLGTNH